MLGIPGYYHVEVLTETISDLLNAVAALKTYPEVLTAGPDYVGNTSGGTLSPINDEYYWRAQWGPQNIGADYAWRASRGQGVKVAVIDKGVYDHPDLIGRVTKGKNYTVGAMPIDP